MNLIVNYEDMVTGESTLCVVFLALSFQEYYGLRCSIAYTYYYRTRSELDTYLVASHIRERAIERITDVTGT